MEAFINLNSFVSIRGVNNTEEVNLPLNVLFVLFCGVVAVVVVVDGGR